MDPERVPLLQKGPVSLRRTRGRWAAFATVGLLLTAACIFCVLLGGSRHTAKLLLLEEEAPHLIGDDTPDQFEHTDPNDEHLPAIANALKDAINAGRQSCSGKAHGDEVSSVHVLSARHQFVSRDDREYEVEVESIDVHGFSQVFVANVRWRHADDELILRSKGTSVLEKAQIVAMVPGPCDLGDSAELVLTSARVDHINAQNLPWTAALNGRFRGVSLDKFSHMLGYKPESAKHKSLFADVLSATPGVVLPAAYDARDTRAHESPCVAFQPKNQGSCGSCYAFGTTSAFATRLCLSSKRAVNFDLSFQEVMDCNTGCNGGTSSDVYNTMYTKPTVPVTCDSYSAVFDPKSCGVHSCQKPLQVFAEKDSYRVYKGVPAMQEELLVNGPGPVAYTVYDDFAAYSGGVYTKSSGAKETGAHMVMLVGWGEEADGTQYWLMQNSWSDTWGDGGFFKMKRGVDECGIESNGMQSAKPRLGTSCPAACQNGGIQSADCSCSCPAGSSGANCQVNSLHCGSGLPDLTGKFCVCPTGFTGKFCQNTVTVSHVAVCDTTPEADWPLISWDFSAESSLAPPAGSRILVLPAATSNLNEAPANSVLWYDELPTQELVKGKFQVPRMTLADGAYAVYLIRSLGINEFGQDKGFPVIIDTSSILSYLHVVPCASVAESNVALSASAQLKLKLETLKASMAAKQISMDKRLDAADAARKAISNRPPPLTPSVFLPTTSYFAKLNGKYLVYTSTPSYRVCYEVDVTVNVPRKILAVRPLGQNSWYPSTFTPLLADSSACAEMTATNRFPVGNYDIALLPADPEGKPDGAPPLAASIPIQVISALAQATGYSFKSGVMKLNVQWDVSLPFFNDYVGIYNSKGTVLAWVYTASKSQQLPKSLSASSSKSTFSFTVQKSSVAEAGDSWTVRFYPAGEGSFYVAGNTLKVPSNF